MLRSVMLHLTLCLTILAANASAETTRAADGLTLHYRCDGSGAPALVFIHGWCCSGDHWDAQRRHFAPTHQVVTIDLAGHGRSQVGRTQWTMEAFGADVQAVMEHLDLKDVLLIGHSMGGPVAVEAALLTPERVRGIIGVDNFQNISLDLTPEQIEGFLVRFRSDFSGATEAWVRGMFASTTDSTLVQRVAREMVGTPPEVGIGALGEFLVWFNQRARGQLARLPVPLQCINSDTHPTDTETLRALVPGYKLHLMPGRGHFVMLEDPVTFNRLLEESLSAFAAD